MEEFYKQKADYGLPGVKEGTGDWKKVGEAVKGSTRGPCDGKFCVGQCQYHDCARSYHWKKLSKGYIGALCIIYYNHM